MNEDKRSIPFSFKDMIECLTISDIVSRMSALTHYFWVSVESRSGSEHLSQTKRKSNFELEINKTSVWVVLSQGQSKQCKSITATIAKNQISAMLERRNQELASSKQHCIIN